MKRKSRSQFASIAGILTTLVTAVEFVDFDELNYHSPNTYIKLAVLLLPAIGGFTSEVKGKKEKTEPQP